MYTDSTLVEIFQCKSFNYVLFSFYWREQEQIEKKIEPHKKENFTNEKSNESFSDVLLCFFNSKS